MDGARCHGRRCGVGISQCPKSGLGAKRSFVILGNVVIEEFFYSHKLVISFWNPSLGFGKSAQVPGAGECVPPCQMTIGNGFGKKLSVSLYLEGAVSSLA